MSKKKNLLSGVASRWVAYLLIFVPAALAFLYVHSFGVNVVARDSWGIVTLFRELFSGELSVADLWALHGEHRILFPRIAMLSLGVLTNYNSVAEMYLTLSCFLLTLIGLLLVFRNDVVKASSSLLLFVPVAFMVFSFRHNDNMLFGFNMQYGMAQAFSVLALCSLYFSGYGRLRRFAFPAALASATVASFSAAQGLFAWPVGLVQLLISPIEKPAKKRLIGVWALIGAVEWVVYFIGYVSPPRAPSPYYALEHPGIGIEFFLTLLGSSLFGAFEFEQQGFAVASGLLLVVLTAVVLLSIYRDGKLGENSLWVALVLFSFLALAAIAVGRAEIWNPEALGTRYTSFAILAPIGVYAMLTKQVFEKRSYPVVLSLGVLSALVALSIPLSYLGGIEVGKALKVARERAAFTLATYESQSDEFLANVHGKDSGANIKGKARILERLGYNVFSEPRSRVLPPPLSELSPIPSTTPSEVELISGARVDQEDQPIQISADEPFIWMTGWAADAEDVAGGVYIDIDGELFPAFYGADREDLADRFGISWYRYAGFDRAMPVSEIGTGTHELSVVVVANDKARYYRPTQEVAFEIR